MKKSLLSLVLGTLLPISAGVAQTPSDSSRSLTIYNQNFAVVRQIVPLDLQSGTNHLTYSDITSQLEPSSVILRDPSGKRMLQILEQNYRADPVTQESLLAIYEGKTIDFLVPRGDHNDIVPGKIVRSGPIPLIDVQGKLQFSLPGQPLFPALADDSILKPTLDWTLRTDKTGPVRAELAYVTDGLNWNADYNLVIADQESVLDLTGWVTISNRSGKTFENASIKLMAGNVHKVIIDSSQPNNVYQFPGLTFDVPGGALPPVTEKPFDEYHLYTLALPTTLRDRETKQVEFVRASGVHSRTVYVYDGAQLGVINSSNENSRQEQEFGTESNPKVLVMREFVNSQTNRLGIPLPRGRMRFYRRDADGQLEFIGENEIDHTPKDETVRVMIGSAFDLTGERTQTDYKINTQSDVIDESFAIKIRNHKKEPATVRIVEHLYRAHNWKITAQSDAFLKKDANTVEFVVTVAPDQEKTVSYTTHYSW